MAIIPLFHVVDKDDRNRIGNLFFIPYVHDVGYARICLHWLTSKTSRGNYSGHILIGHIATTPPRFKKTNIGEGLYISLKTDHFPISTQNVTHAMCHRRRTLVPMDTFMYAKTLQYNVG
jgi:hypothetical protein